jgi:hypothetical protein
MRTFIRVETTAVGGATETASASIRKAGRPGTTAMEYLMMISLIVVAALTGIGYFGSMTGNMTQATSNAISNSVKSANK